MVVCYRFGIWLMVSAECMEGPRAPTPQRCSAGCSAYRQCVLEGCGSEIRNNPNYDTGCRTSVAVHNATVHQPLTTVSPNSNPRNLIQQQYSQSKSQKNFRPSTAQKHIYQGLKCTYVKDYSQAIARLTAEAGRTRRVAGQVDCSECAVRNCWEQWTREGTYVRKTGSGATRKTTRREDRRIVRQALVDPTVTCSMIRAGVGVAIVPQTISRHLAEANLKSKRHFRALPLTPKHRQLRLQWCQARSMWNVTD
ncbi:HTH_Tnp_Tc3_2 domain-containing protein [Trichonephila clavipes]|nr:HTH_Tnp_Tc3_2 domain-containing protein [Trichonephila clavipes]